jgi:small subunit ribosomal protein S9
VADIQYYGTGRRKTSTARVYLRPGAGDVVVNRKAFDRYFPNETLRMIIRQPLQLTETTAKFDVLINVKGGGPTARPEPFDTVSPAHCSNSTRTFARH